MMLTSGRHHFHRAEGPSAEFDLAAGKAWSAPAPHGVAVRCERGTVWVTVEGDPEDHIVVAPGTFATHAHGRVAALALEPAHLAVEPVE